MFPGLSLPNYSIYSRMCCNILYLFCRLQKSFFTLISLWPLLYLLNDLAEEQQNMSMHFHTGSSFYKEKWFEFEWIDCLLLIKTELLTPKTLLRLRKIDAFCCLYRFPIDEQGIVLYFLNVLFLPLMIPNVYWPELSVNLRFSLF